ncbi:MAG: FAD-dependent oxidoreductase [Simkaniaceae bacterium]|nr:FAD-dependent oxidoreductase [Simkaniaceae bacterium]
MENKYQIIVIGAGSGGLVVAIGSAKASKSVLLIEKGAYGGDCTNFGCIPSKSLIASADRARAILSAKEYGITGDFSSVNTDQVFDRVQKIVKSIRSHEEPDALGKMGVKTENGAASFIDAHRLEINKTNGEKITVFGEQIVIATGSRAFIPRDLGLDNTPYLTNETIFSLKTVPKSLCILGAGPIGVEMAQAFSRLGSKVALVHRHSHILNREEVEVQQTMEKVFLFEGMELNLGFNTQKVSFADEKFRLQIQSDVKKKEIIADALLVAVGRRANVATLNLERAGVRADEKGVFVDKYGRSSKKNIWAVGDVVRDGANFTHVAENQARAVLTSLLLPWKTKISKQAIPRVTFTDPEVASFGLSEKQATEKYGKKVAIYFIPNTSNDRAITSGETAGFVKVITKKWSGKILGGTIISHAAGEMLMELTLAAKENISIRKLASLIHPYPTYSLILRKVADLWLSQTFLPAIQKVFRRK